MIRNAKRKYTISRCLFLNQSITSSNTRVSWSTTRTYNQTHDVYQTVLSCIEKSQWKEALVEINECIKEETVSDLANIYRIRAMCNTQLYNYSQALVDCEMAEKIRPSILLELFDTKATCLVRLCLGREVSKMFTKLSAMVEQDPDEVFERRLYFLTLHHLGKCFELEMNDRLEDALEYFIEYVEPKIEPLPIEYCFPLMHTMITLLLYSQRYQQAMIEAEEYIDMIGEDDYGYFVKIDSLLLRATTYAYCGQLDVPLTDLVTCEIILSRIPHSDPNIKEANFLLALAKARIYSNCDGYEEDSKHFYQTAMTLAIEMNALDYQRMIRSEHRDSTATLLATSTKRIDITETSNLLI
jgi:tetratricopeptide (TPR) repeat protein